MATQRVAPPSSRIPLKPKKVNPKPSLVIPSEKVELVAQQVSELAAVIRPDPRTGKTRPGFSAPWLRGYKHPNWQPGQSGNPKGRPSYKKFAEIYRQLKDQIDPETGLAFGELVALAQFKNAIDGRSVFAAREIREACDGKLLADASSGELAEQGISSVKQKLMQKLIKVETDNNSGKTTVTISESSVVGERQMKAERLPLRPMRALMQGEENV